MFSIAQEFLGSGLIIPLTRLGGNDFVVSSGVQLVRSTIRQIIGTERGELRWRPGFGVTLTKYKNKINNDALESIVADNIESSIIQFEPRVNVISVSVTRTNNLLVAKITWSVIDHNTDSNQVLLGPDTFEVTI